MSIVRALMRLCSTVLGGRQVLALRPHGWFHTWRRRVFMSGEMAQRQTEYSKLCVTERITGAQNNRVTTVYEVRVCYFSAPSRKPSQLVRADSMVLARGRTHRECLESLYETLDGLSDDVVQISDIARR